MSKYKILIAEPNNFNTEVVDYLRKYAIVDVKSCKDNEVKKALEEYDVFWFRLGYTINHKVLSSNTRCKILATPVTGIDHINKNDCLKYGISIVSLKGEYEFLKDIRATSELTIGLMISIMRKIPNAYESVKTGIWNRDIFRGYELYKKTLGIIGYGRLGKIVAKYANAIGMNIAVYDINKIEKTNEFNIAIIENIYKLANISDVVSVHVSYDKNSHELINKSFFNNCKTNSIFINTSRGGVVNEKDLLNALINKNIKGAALDVLQREESISMDNPLIQYANNNDNLIIVPHIGGNTYESFRKTELFIAQKIINIIEKL